MIDFLKESRTFGGITFRGHYDMDLSDFEKMYHHYLLTDENLLDDYSAVMYMTWETDSIINTVIDGDEYNKRMESISKMRSLGLFDPDDLCELRSLIRESYRRYIKRRAYNSSKAVKRRKACVFTSKKEIRESVFSIWGENCLSCGSEEDIELDHIKPVCNGGKNEINNLQPLCKTCNVSKGTKTIDYRENAQHLTV